VEDLPEAWNEKMRDYLGIMPPDDSHGVLQDIHWSGGGFGYFPTYALGNLVAAQLWECIHKDIPGLEDSFRRGDFSSLLEWLRQNVHRHGAKYQRSRRSHTLITCVRNLARYTDWIHNPLR
jgi:carboxypeptidase Taq